MFAQNFKLKLVGPRTHGITPLDTLQWLYEPKDSINRDQGLSKTCTIAKHTRKQLKLFEALAIEIGLKVRNTTRRGVELCFWKLLLSRSR